MNQGALFIFLVIFLTAATSEARNGNSCSPLTPKLLETASEFLCQEPPIGQTVFVHHNSKESPSKIPTMYALKRVDDKKYRIEFNLDFIEHSTLRALKQTFVKGSENPFEKKMRDKVNACLREYNKRLLGPGGQSLEFALIDPPRGDGAYRQIRADILISKKAKFRSNSREYAHDASCETIIHELLHLTGLADEYVEIATDRASYDCRVYGMSNSTMNQGEHAVSRGVRAAFVSGYHCECTNAQLCARKQPTAECNMPGFRRNEFNFNILDSELNKPDSIALLASASKLSVGLGIGLAQPQLPSKAFVTRVTRFPEMPTGSLLYPAHFRAITRPGCHRDNSKYYECARFAYDSSERVLLKAIGRECPQKPAFCEDMTWLK